MDFVADIDLPSVKQTLWHQAHADLRSFMPGFSHEFLLYPTCFRQMRFDDLSIEHIIPRQAVDRDPKDVREAITRNQRSGLTLLCNKPLLIKGKVIKGHGCNSWKGQFFDGPVRELIHSNCPTLKPTSRHQVALFSIGYLALFKTYGYRISFSSSGLLMRNQFFVPNVFLKEVPLRHQIVLFGEPLTELNDDNKTYWDEPFKFTIENDVAFLAVRSVGFDLPLSGDPTKPLARTLLYAPPKYKLRPDLKTVFD
jgi:hypothetical protein